MPALRFSCLLPFAIFLPLAAYAHTDVVTGQDYSGFERNDGRGSCCNWLDCRPAFAPFMEKDGEKIVDRGQNKFRFDPDIVVKRPSEDGNWHVCGTGNRLHCIIAPPQAMLGDGLRYTLFTPSDAGGNAIAGVLPTAEEIARQLAAVSICRAPGM